MFFTNELFIDELRSCKGLIPTGIAANGNEIRWTDLGMYHFYEGFFRKSIRVYSSLLKNSPIVLTTALSMLEDDRIAGEHVIPRGLIFHAGHCGSTALAKSLSASRSNLVLSEAVPIGQLLSTFSAAQGISFEKKTFMLRQLILAMCRKRVNTHKRAFIKFTSHNIHHYELIAAALPEVPAIFLYRDKTSIVESFRKKPPGWLKGEVDLEESVESFLSKAFSIPDSLLKKIGHDKVSAENLPDILGHFKIITQPGELQLMQSQFRFDSKVEFNRKIFKR